MWALYNPTWPTGGTEWRRWTSPDLVNWTDRGVSIPRRTTSFGDVWSGSAVVDTRAQLLDNVGGTIGSQVGTLEIRSGALNNAGGRLQSQAALLLQTNGQAITNTGSGSNGGILASGRLQVDGGALDNRGGAVFAQGDARLTVASVGTPAHGTSAINPGGSVIYTPALNYTGGDGFTYTISDGQGGSATATVSVTVTAVNDAPAAADDAASTLEDTAVGIPVLANDSDIDGDTLTVTLARGTSGSE